MGVLSGDQLGGVRDGPLFFLSRGEGLSHFLGSGFFAF